MRSVLGFFSLLAVGFLAAGIVVVAGSSSSSRLGTWGAAGTAGAPPLDLTSLFIGLALGLLLSALARISWAELPGRTVHWLLTNERNFMRLGWVALFVAVLIFY